MLKTLHGAFEFRVQKYQFEGTSLSYLELTQPESRPDLGRGLQEFCAYYSNRLSYREVSELVKRQCGTQVLSSQGIWQFVQHQAQQISDAIERNTDAGLSEARIEVATAIDLYNETCAEVVLPVLKWFYMTMRLESKLRNLSDSAKVNRRPRNLSIRRPW